MAIFSVLGNWPLSNALFIIRFRGVARAGADMFINLDGISSKPEDFFGLIDFRGGLWGWILCRGCSRDFGFVDHPR